MSGSTPSPLRWISRATDQTDRQMAEAGFRRVRSLFQMRRPLPVEDDLRAATRPIVTRAFNPGTDVAGFLQVNNRAFSWHPEQGGWTVENLIDRMAEPWFDPAGFLIHESGTSPESDTTDPPGHPGGTDGSGETNGPGQIDGFCWTKIHAPTDDDPAMGEIFVIAADPSTHGTGLGRALTVAGLDHLSAAGLSVGMLYVEHDNEAAVKLYERLGFGVHHTDAAYGPV